MLKGTCNLDPLVPRIKQTIGPKRLCPGIELKIKRYNTFNCRAVLYIPDEKETHIVTFSRLVYLLWFKLFNQ